MASLRHHCTSLPLSPLRALTRKGFIFLWCPLGREAFDGPDVVYIIICLIWDRNLLPVPECFFGGVAGGTMWHKCRLSQRSFQRLWVRVLVFRVALGVSWGADGMELHTRSRKMVFVFA